MKILKKINKLLKKIRERASEWFFFLAEPLCNENGFWGLLAAAALAGGTAYLNYRAASEQAKALGKASKYEKRYQQGLISLQQQYFDLMNQLLKEGKPLRQAQSEAYQEIIKRAQAIFPALQEDVLRKPGESLLYQQALKRGTADVIGALQGYGVSPRSSVAARTVGELGSSLLAQEEAAIRGDRYKLASLALGLPVTSSTSTGLALAPLAANVAAARSRSVGRLGGIQSDIGATRSELYKSYGSILPQVLPYLLNT
jgi:hypothetical protein